MRTFGRRLPDDPPLPFPEEWIDALLAEPMTLFWFESTRPLMHDDYRRAMAVED